MPGMPRASADACALKGNRSTSLRDARKLGLFPSVTNVLSVLAKPGLEAWKQEQAIMAALTLPRNEDEPLDAFARRVVADMTGEVKSAADLGSSIHAAIEAYAQGRWVPEDKAVAELFEPARQWFDAEVLQVHAVEIATPIRCTAMPGGWTWWRPCARPDGRRSSTSRRRR